MKSQLETEVERSRQLTAQVDREYLKAVELEGDLQLTRLKLEDVHTELKVAVSKNEELERLVAETEKALANTRMLLEQETEKSEGLAQELSRTQSQSAELESELEQTRKNLEDLQETVSILGQERDTLKEQLSWSEEQQAVITQQLNQQVITLHSSSKIFTQSHFTPQK